MRTIQRYYRGVGPVVFTIFFHFTNGTFGADEGGVEQRFPSFISYKKPRMVHFINRLIDP